MSFLRYFILSLLCWVSFVNGQFGVNRQQTTEEVEIGVNGDVSPREIIASKLMSANPALTEQTAIDIAELIAAAKKDPETSLLLRRMKDGSGSEEFKALMDSDLSAEKITMTLAQAVEEIKLLDILFRDPERALKEMQNDGLIQSDMLPRYKKDPSLLEDDTRKSLYFTFVSLAAAGGYL